jgi:glycosyltransferase involved in cell wall biosynthesis
MMNILHLIPGNLYGGVETFLVTLARHRDLCPDLRNEFAVCHEGRLSQELRADDARVHMLSPPRLSRPWTVWRARRELRTLLAAHPASVVVAHHLWPLLVFGPAVRAAGRRLVLYVHGPVTSHGWIERLARRHVPDRVIGVSRDTIATHQLLFPSVSATLVHYPLPRDEASFSLTEAERQALRCELHTSPDAVVILQASRMEPWKGQDIHLAALARLTALPNWVCWLAGGSQRPAELRYLQTLRDQVARTGLTGRVRFLGERRDVPRLMAAADVYCQGNRGPEGWSLAFLEALTAGLPIVTSAIGGAVEMIDATCGCLVPPDDAAALAAALHGLIVDGERRDRMAHGARERAQALSAPRRQLAAVQTALIGTPKAVCA